MTGVTTGRREKADLEKRVQVLKTMLVSQGMTPADIANALQTLASESAVSSEGAGSGRKRVLIANSNNLFGLPVFGVYR